MIGQEANVGERKWRDRRDEEKRFSEWERGGEGQSKG